MKLKRLLLVLLCLSHHICELSRLVLINCFYKTLALPLWLLYTTIKLLFCMCLTRTMRTLWTLCRSVHDEPIVNSGLIRPHFEIVLNPRL